MFWRRIVQQGVCLGGMAAALFLIVVGLAKAFDTEPMVKAVQAHGLVPSAWAGFVAPTAITLEIVAGIAALGLIALMTRARLGLVVLAAMGAALTLYAGMVWAMPPDQPASCGCGLVADAGPANWAAITLRNAVASGLMLVGSMAQPKRLIRQGHHDHEFQPSLAMG